jgi:tetratricopeptide (TPR) repeat protein
MLRPQIYITFIALVAVAALTFMPRAVVNNNPAKVNEEVTGKDKNQQNDDIVKMHQSSLSETQSKQLEQFRSQWSASSTREQKAKVLDSLLVLFRSVNMYDSAAHYTGLFAELFPNIVAFNLAGDAYYEAFGFALDAQKSAALASEARKFYQLILERDPSRLDIRTKLGMTYVSSDNPMQGITMIREVLKEDPDNEFAIFNLGLLSMQSGQLDKARERFEQLLKLNPDDTRAMFYLALSFYELGRKDEARKYFLEVKEREKSPEILATIEKYLSDLE